MERKFYITEVFAEGPYRGNQLATLPAAADLTAEEMQQIARAFNFSESTFITGGDLANGFDVRIFTPNAELAFAGHPTLGTAWLLLREILKTEEPQITLNLGVGKIPVTFDDDDLGWMRQQAPVFGDSVDPGQVAAALGLDASDISASFPCQYVSTGLEFLIVPLRTMAALRSMKSPVTDFGHGLLAFCPQGYEAGQDIGARMFALEYGVIEDPATGSANGCLAAYLVAHQYFGSSSVDVRVGQGYEIARPSQLYLRATRSGETWEINVGGKVGLVAEGQWKA